MLGRMIASLVRRVYVFILPVLLGGALASCQHLPAQLATAGNAEQAEISSPAPALAPNSDNAETSESVDIAAAALPSQTEENTASPSDTEQAIEDSPVQDNLVQENTEQEDSNTKIEDESDAESLVVASANIAPAPKKAEQPAIPLFTPASQIGKLADSLNIVIGEADFIRQDGQIEIWQYQQPDCVVDFYVPLGDSEKNHISGWDMRPRIFGNQLDIQLCKAQLADRAP